jgi:S-adenosylmethionine synthetase
MPPDVIFVICFRELNLRNPIYQQTSTYGHFGRDMFPWEQPKKLVD